MSKTKMGVIGILIALFLEPAAVSVILVILGAWFILSLFITQLKDSAADLESRY